MEHLLEETDRDRSPPRELRPPLQGDGEHVLGVHGAVHEPDRRGLLAGEKRAQQEQLPGPGLADPADQRPGDAPAHEGSEGRLGQAQLRPFGRHHQVARERELQPGPDRVTVDRRHDRQRERLEQEVHLACTPRVPFPIRRDPRPTRSSAVPALSLVGSGLRDAGVGSVGGLARRAPRPAGDRGAGGLRRGRPVRRQ